MDAILNVAVTLQVLVCQPFDEVRVHTCLRHLIRVLIESFVYFFQPIVELARVT